MKVTKELLAQWIEDWHTDTGEMHMEEFIAQRAADWAVAAEREACAAICEAIAEDRWALFPLYKVTEPRSSEGFTVGECVGAIKCANEIRARGDK